MEVSASLGHGVFVAEKESWVRKEVEPGEKVSGCERDDCSLSREKRFLREEVIKSLKVGKKKMKTARRERREHERPRVWKKEN